MTSSVIIAPSGNRVPGEGPHEPVPCLSALLHSDDVLLSTRADHRKVQRLARQPVFAVGEPAVQPRTVLQGTLLDVRMAAAVLHQRRLSPLPRALDRPHLVAVRAIVQSLPGDCAPCKGADPGTGSPAKGSPIVDSILKAPFETVLLGQLLCKS